jgi:hypothetical protein
MCTNAEETDREREDCVSLCVCSSIVKQQLLHETALEAAFALARILIEVVRHRRGHRHIAS